MTKRKDDAPESSIADVASFYRHIRPKPRIFRVCGEKVGIRTLGVLADVAPSTVDKRLRLGWTVEEIILGRRKPRKRETQRKKENDVANYISEKKKKDIIALASEGASISEIAEKLGVSKPTVARYSGHRDTSGAKLVEEVMVILRALGIDPESIDPLVQLYMLTHKRCMRHQKADPDKDFFPDGGCRLCRGDAIARAHDRRREKQQPHRIRVAI